MTEEYLNLLRSGHAIRVANYYHKKSMKEIDDAVNKLLDDTFLLTSK